MNFVFIFSLAVIGVKGAYEGTFCDANGVDGICKRISECPTAIEDIRSNKTKPVTCGFIDKTVIVCCRKPESTTTKNPILTTERIKETTTEYMPKEYDYENLDGRTPEELCAPIPANFTSKPTGQKAWDKCLEYQNKYVFPCEKGNILTGSYGRVNKCHHNADELIIGGMDAKEWEFPHLVLLGHMNDQNEIVYQCGGALISEKFVLTAGHCITDTYHNNVSHALVGILRRSQGTKENQYLIKRIIKHDFYKPPRKYNDIALLELDRAVLLDDTTVPACLHTGDPVDDTRASTAGWGTTTARYVSNSDILKKVILTKFKTEECSAEFEINHNMPIGYHLPTQICYGDRTKSQDTCRGDSGGPLQVKSKKIACMYTIVGVTSFGSGCGSIGVPGIYTRVSHYLSWIESIVWPN